MERTVLVVEDEEDIRESLCDAFRDEGYTVAVASNGQEALALLPRLPQPCAIVLDIMMPVMSGRDFYETLRADARFEDIPVVVSTSDPSRAPAGVLTLKKPIDLDKLMKVVQSFFADPTPQGGGARLARRAPLPSPGPAPGDDPQARPAL
jgi:CheY-like chemotaxis protein